MSMLGLELTDFWGTVNAYRDQLTRTSRADRQGRREADQHHRRRSLHQGNNQDFQRYPEVDLAIAADAEATLPSLIEAVRAPAHRRSHAARSQERGAALAADRQRAARSGPRGGAPYAWDASPISTARLCAELWAQIKNDDWSLVSATAFVSNWPLRLWNFDKPYRFIGASGGCGLGYGAPAAVGAALANRKYGRLRSTSRTTAT